MVIMICIVIAIMGINVFSIKLNEALPNLYKAESKSFGIRFEIKYSLLMNFIIDIAGFGHREVNK